MTALEFRSEHTEFLSWLSQRLWESNVCQPQSEPLGTPGPFEWQSPRSDPDMFLSPTSYSTVRPSCYCPDFAHFPISCRTFPISCVSTGVIYVAATTGLWPLTKHSRTFNHSTGSFPGLINSSPDKSRIGNPFIWAVLLILYVKKHTFTYIKQLLPFGLWLRSVWYDQTASYACNDCSCPRL